MWVLCDQSTIEISIVLFVHVLEEMGEGEGRVEVGGWGGWKWEDGEWERECGRWEMWSGSMALLRWP